MKKQKNRKKKKNHGVRKVYHGVRNFYHGVRKVYHAPFNSTIEPEAEPSNQLKGMRQAFNAGDASLPCDFPRSHQNR